MVSKVDDTEGEDTCFGKGSFYCRVLTLITTIKDKKQRSKEATTKYRTHYPIDHGFV